MALMRTVLVPTMRVAYQHESLSFQCAPCGGGSSTQAVGCQVDQFEES